MTLIVLGDVDSLWSAHQGVLGQTVLRSSLVLVSFKVNTMRHFDLEEFHSGLIDSEICHLDVEAVEVNTTETFLHVLRELSLADLVEPQVVGEGARLVELAE